MKKNRLNLGLSIFLFGLLYISSSALAGNDEKNIAPSPYTDKLKATQLMEERQPDKAYKIYIRLLRSFPEDDEINLGLARSAVQSGRTDHAVMAYERLLESRPDLIFIYEEAIQAYLTTGDRQMAALYAKKMAALTKQSSNTSKDITGGNQGLWRWGGYLRGGLTFDTNANQGPISDIMDLGIWSGVTVPDAKAVSSLGTYFGGSLNTSRRFAAESPWYAVSGADFFWRGNANDTLSRSGTREMQWGRGNIGLRYSDGFNLAEVRLKAEIFDYEFERRVNAIGPEFAYVRALTPNLQAIADLKLEQRSYSYSDDRDGQYGHAGAYLRLFFDKQQHNALAGMKYLGGRADFNDFDYNGWESSLHFSFKLPADLEFKPFAVYTTETYKGPATALENVRRKDKRIRIGGTMLVPVKEDWFIEFSWQYVNNDSTSPIYDYDQQQTNVGFFYRF